MNRLLRIAVTAGVENAVQVHVDRGDNINARDESGQTPLMLAAARNREGICKLLLSAGADPGLLDPLGRDALRIAQTAGAIEAALAIEAACRSSLSAPPLATVAVEERSQPYELAQFTLSSVAPPVDKDVNEHADAFDLAAWEADDEQSAPKGNPLLAVVATKTQSAITDHRPLDTSADWEDFDAFLPDRATPLPRHEDADAREQLRLALLRAVREGSIPGFLVDDLTRRDDGQPDAEARAMLTMVINDLGAEIDERLEYSSRDESFEVFVAPDQTSDEEEIVAEAVGFLDDLAFPRNEPLRIYQRQLQRAALLSAAEEVALGQAMERGIEQALDALASWAEGVDAVLASAREVARGAKPLRWMSSGSQTGPQDEQSGGAAAVGNSVREGEQEIDDQSAGEGESADSGYDAAGSDLELGEFCARAELLAGARGREQRDSECWQRRRDALASLRLARAFLMEIAESPLRSDPESAEKFAHATRAYRLARDRMAEANLKLVHSIAKKYLFSGLPFDDLLQEGNIGLLKAVDRFDWRKGFKFSTYATWWIRQQVSRFVADTGKTIRLPVHVYEKTQRIAQAARAFEFQRGRDASDEELADLVDMPVRKVQALVRMSLEPLPIHELPDLDDLVATDAKDYFIASDPRVQVEEMEVTKLVDRILGSLGVKEQNVLRMRFGIGIADAMTLEEIGARAGVTRERIRQIEAKAIKRLKHPARVDPLRQELGLEPERRRGRVIETPAEDDDRENDDASAIAEGAARDVELKISTSVATSLDKTSIEGHAAMPVVEDCLESESREKGSGR